MKKIIIVFLFVMLLSGCNSKTYQVVNTPTDDYYYGGDYIISINTIESKDMIEIIKSVNSTVEEINAKNNMYFIVIDLTISRINTIDQTKDFILEQEDFLLKDHKGMALKKIHFSNVNVIEDYSWIGKSFSSNESATITIAFEIDNKNQLTNKPMVLEVDFIVEIPGVDIELNHEGA